VLKSTWQLIILTFQHFFVKTTSIEKLNLKGMGKWGCYLQKKGKKCSLGVKDATHWIVCVT